MQLFTEAAAGYFNTSHVNVNQFKLAYCHFDKMYFNTSHVNVNLKTELQCCYILPHFNTSHVNVNPIGLPVTESVLYFNTSHVNVNRLP